MIFKNAHIYRIVELSAASADALESQLSGQSFKPCSGIRPASFGWVPPIAGGALVHEVGGSMLLCAKREDKVVPTSALADVLNEKIERLESLESRPVKAREKQRLKEDALAELLPRALPKSKQIFGYINTSEELLVIDTASGPEAEMFLNCLRETLGSLKVMPPQVKSRPMDTYTHWLRTRKLPDNFSLGDQCDLVDPEDTSTVSCRRQDLATSEIRNHLDAGKICSRLSVIWHGDLRVTLDKDLVLRQIKVMSSDDSAPEDLDPVAQLDAAFMNMTLELARFLPELFAALGGENRS